MTARLAPAKVNLFLHVGPVAEDGYHPVVSLMAFADVGDVVTLEPGDRQQLTIEGEFGAALAGEPVEGNLMWRAAKALLSRIGREGAGFSLRLDKALPVASGLGGGSGDAGAALRLLREAFAPDLPNTTLTEIAAGLGADGPACLWARPVLGSGRGDVLESAPALPELHAVLVNPRTPSPTGAVYRAYDAAPRPLAERPDLRTVGTLEGLLLTLQGTRNDLEPPAAALSADIAEVLRVVRAAPQTRLGRLSGSGATVFALVEDAAAARSLAARLRGDQPGWWVRACRLGGPWSATV